MWSLRNLGPASHRDKLLNKKKDMFGGGELTQKSQVELVGDQNSQEGRKRGPIKLAFGKQWPLSGPHGSGFHRNPLDERRSP